MTWAGSYVDAFIVFMCLFLCIFELIFLYFCTVKTFDKISFGFKTKFRTVTAVTSGSNGRVEVRWTGLVEQPRSYSPA